MQIAGESLMSEARTCPRCRETGVQLVEVVSLVGGQAAGRWKCSSCEHLFTAFRRVAELEPGEREHVLRPFQRRLEEWYGERPG
jgi:transcriptional regulator NrdR family protein